MVHVSSHRHLQAACQGFEDSLNLMMLIRSLGFNVEVHLRGITQTLKEVEEHLCRHLSNLLPFEFGIPHEPGPPSESECHRAQTVVHRPPAAITLDASIVTEFLQASFAQGQSCVFNGVMLVNIKVAFRMDRNINHPMMANLFQHVVKES